MTIGAQRFQIRAALRAEPDKLAGGIGFGARAIISAEALAASGLVLPGSIIRYLARVNLQSDASDDNVAQLAEAANAAFPKAGWEIRKRDAVSRNSRAISNVSRSC